MRFAWFALCFTACTQSGDGFYLRAHVTSTAPFDTAIVVEDDGTPNSRSLGAATTSWDYENGGLFSGPAKLQVTIELGGNVIATATALDIEYHDDDGTAEAELNLPVNP